MKVSVVATVLNEENTIGLLLDSLLAQLRSPDEIVIVDGGSADGTAKIITAYAERNRKIKLIVEKGSIAHGRNMAIKRAKHMIIAQIDGGCVAEPDWLGKIIEPFDDPNVGLVAGFYRMVGESNFQKAVAPYHGVVERRYDPRSFMPSGRSMAFRKDVWKKVGGYSETLERAGEDTLFNYQIVKQGIKIVRVKSAVVNWEVPKDYWLSLKKLYYYAKGDAQAAIWWHPAQRLATHNIRILMIFLRYVFGLVLLVAGLSEGIFLYLLFILSVFYACWAVYKHEDVVHEVGAKLWLPLIQVGSDLTVMVGFVGGLLSRDRI